MKKSKGSIKNDGVKIIFIIRIHPPFYGGLLAVNLELYRYLSGMSEVKLIEWRKPKKYLLLGFLYFLFKVPILLLTQKIDVIYLGDGLLSPIGLVLKIFKKPVATTVHGLDVTYKNKFYQFLIPKCIARLDRVICVSRATAEECIKRGVSKEKIKVISDPISDVFYLGEDKKIIRKKIEEKIGLSLKDKKIILSVGRLVERKGFHWFVGSVVPKLLEKRNDFIYLTVGEGAYEEKIEEAIKENHLEDYVKMLGRVDEAILKLLYNGADIFVMPNIPARGDMEGFGIVILEAASCKLPIVASNLEGIRDAIKEGENGFLVEPYNVKDYVKKINELLENDLLRENFGKIAREYTIKNYSGEKIVKEYFNEFEVLKNKYAGQK